MAVAVAVGVGDTGTVGLAVADEVAIEDGVKDAVGVGVTVAEHNAKSVVGSMQLFFASNEPSFHHPARPAFVLWNQTTLVLVSTHESHEAW